MGLEHRNVGYAIPSFVSLSRNASTVPLSDPHVLPARNKKPRHCGAFETPCVLELRNLDNTDQILD